MKKISPLYTLKIYSSNKPIKSLKDAKCINFQQSVERYFDVDGHFLVGDFCADIKSALDKMTQ